MHIRVWCSLRAFIADMLMSSDQGSYGIFHAGVKHHFLCTQCGAREHTILIFLYIMWRTWHNLNFMEIGWCLIYEADFLFPGKGAMTITQYWKIYVFRPGLKFGRDWNMSVWLQLFTSYRNIKVPFVINEMAWILIFLRSSLDDTDWIWKSSL